MESKNAIDDVFGRWCYEPRAKYDTIVKSIIGENRVKYFGDTMRGPSGTIGSNHSSRELGLIFA